MDNQRLLFKKFFGGSSGTSNSIGSSSSVASNENKPASPSGFNPPKFQFNKKKLGLEGFNRMENNENRGIDENRSDTIREIDSIEIEPFDELLEDNDDDIVCAMTMNMDQERDAISAIAIATPTPINSNTKNNNQIGISSDQYNRIIEKNRQKYYLSSQLSSFSVDIQTALQRCEENFGKIDLLVLGIDEKIAEVHNFNLDILLRD